MKKAPGYVRAESVAAYIARHPKKLATRLRALRAAVKRAAPGTQERISYGMPGYKLAGKPFVYFASFKNHMSLFALPSAVVKFKKELASFKTSRGTIQFLHSEPLPLPLIRKILAFRAKENLVRVKK